MINKNETIALTVARNLVTLFGIINWSLILIPLSVKNYCTRYEYGGFYGWTEVRVFGIIVAHMSRSKPWN